MRVFAFLSVFCWTVSLSVLSPLDAKANDYVVVVSRQTHEQADWKPVVEALRTKHDAHVIVFDESLDEARADLQQHMPRYTCFVATPAEAGRTFVADVHQLTRQLDTDPYTDTLWGILTGYDAQNALRIAEHAAPLTIHRVASGTDVELAMCDEGVWYCELEKNRMVRKLPGDEPQQLVGPDDTTLPLVNTLNEYHAQLMVTSGHATERNWQIGFRYRNGYFRSENGRLYGEDTAGTRHWIDSPNPKVYLPVGNCLMGHVDGRDAMALAWMNSAGVHQMIGYTVPTWYGYGGWGMLDYFLEQPGRFTAAEAFFANHQALLHRLEMCEPGLSSTDQSAGSLARRSISLSEKALAAGVTQQDVQGLLFDRDVVAFYGDPAWQARMAPADCAWNQTLEVQDGEFTLTITPNRGADTFAVINKNGSQRGGRPIVQLLPRRIGRVEVVEGAELDPVITDDFVLIPNPREVAPDKAYRVRFREIR